MVVEAITFETFWIVVVDVMFVNPLPSPTNLFALTFPEDVISPVTIILPLALMLPEAVICPPSVPIANLSTPFCLKEIFPPIASFAILSWEVIEIGSPTISDCESVSPNDINESAKKVKVEPVSSIKLPKIKKVDG